MADAHRKRGRKNQIVGQFAPRPIPMLESPAYRVLSLSAHKVLSRLEIEHVQHGGRDNGKLPCTYQHFEEYGVYVNAIGAAIRELEALGFVEVTHRGVGGNANERTPSLYRLTYRHVDGTPGDGTHDYLKITTVADAEMRAKQARLWTNARSADNGKKTDSRPWKARAKPPTETVGENPIPPPMETMGTVPPMETMGTSISRPGTVNRNRRAPTSRTPSHRSPV